MTNLFRRHIRENNVAQSLGLGPLEAVVMEAIWQGGEGSVREVTHRLERTLAYTTVMTTLDRLYKKGLLERRKSDRAFFYTAALSRLELEKKRAGDFVAPYLESPGRLRELLLSCLVDAAGAHDVEVLEDLERQIKAKRQELQDGRNP